MFSGIVDGVAILHSICRRNDYIQWSVIFPYVMEDNLLEGSSISLDGVCLTATNINGDMVSFDLIQETLERSTLGEKKVGSRLNFERSLKFGEEVGGHLVSGHVMAVGTIQSINSSNSNHSLVPETIDIQIQTPLEIAEYIFEKGYIAIDGISLTIGKVHQDSVFDLHIIPETIRRTTLGSKEVDSTVNIEIDTLTKSVVETVKRVVRKEENE